MNDQLLTPSETRARLRCSLARVYALSSGRVLPKYKVGGRLFFKKSDIEAYLDSCRVEAREEITV